VDAVNGLQPRDGLKRAASRGEGTVLTAVAEAMEARTEPAMQQAAPSEEVALEWRHEKDDQKMRFDKVRLVLKILMGTDVLTREQEAQLESGSESDVSMMLNKIFTQKDIGLALRVEAECYFESKSREAYQNEELFLMTFRNVILKASLPRKLKARKKGLSCASNSSMSVTSDGGMSADSSSSEGTSLRQTKKNSSFRLSESELPAALDPIATCFTTDSSTLLFTTLSTKRTYFDQLDSTPAMEARSKNPVPWNGDYAAPHFHHGHLSLHTGSSYASQQRMVLHGYQGVPFKKRFFSEQVLNVSIPFTPDTRFAYLEEMPDKYFEDADMEEYLSILSMPESEH